MPKTFRNDARFARNVVKWDFLINFQTLWWSFPISPHSWTRMEVRNAEICECGRKEMVAKIVWNRRHPKAARWLSVKKVSKKLWIHKTFRSSRNEWWDWILRVVKIFVLHYKSRIHWGLSILYFLMFWCITLGQESIFCTFNFESNY